MNILVTGGAGFIGAHLVRALMEAGHYVVIFDNFSEFLYSVKFKRDRLKALIPTIPAQQVVMGDLNEAALLNAVFNERPFDLVIHLAALANPGLSVTAAEAYYTVNVEGTKTLLQQMTAHHVTRLIYAGSSSIYNDEVIPFKEDGGPVRPRSPYGKTKAEAETVITLWQQEQPTERSVTILRFFSVYGPWCRPDMAPMIFARKIMAGETISLTANIKRDFTYIDDTVQGIVAAVGKKFPLEVINLGRGNPTTLEEFISAIETASGLQATTEPRDVPEGEMRVTYADISKAQRLLGYQPTVSVAEGTARLVAWLKTYQFD